jgi:hypothetical protein
MAMQKTRKILVMSMLLGMGLPQTAVAQEDSPEATAESGEIDEIVVLGARSLTLLRQEVIVAEDRFFDLYNELNDDDKYDIVCETRRPIGTRIQVRECKAQFVKDAEYQATQDALQFSESPANVTARAIRASTEDYEILDEKLKTFAVSSPELQEALMEYDGLNKKYADEREKKFD